MAEGTLGRNLTFPIKNADGTSFHGLSLKKATYNTVVMALGDKITGDVYYQDNTLAVSMQEYIEFKHNPNDASEDAVKFVLVNPPTVVKERMASDNGELKGMTKYSFEFYHPMYMLGNFPFTDVAVTSNQLKYLPQNTTFSWIGTLVDFVAKINKNLQGTQWLVEIGNGVQPTIYNRLSEVLSFDKQTIADALKKGYEIWKVPYIIDVIKSGETGYSSGKRFKVLFGLPIQEIIDSQGHAYIFRCGQGVGLKNNSRTPRNNKIVTRIAGYGSEDNIQYGYPQIIWTGNQSWNYTVNNSSTAPNSYPIYDGIVNGQKVRLIKHPFTRTHLMPSIYRQTVNRKVNPNATGYDPDTEIKDYYDAVNTPIDTWVNPIVVGSPSYDIHEFEDIKPELGDDKQIVSAVPAAQEESSSNYYASMQSFLSYLQKLATQSNISIERAVLHEMYERIQTDSSWSLEDVDEQYWYKASFTKNTSYAYVSFESPNINFTSTVLYNNAVTPEWDDTMDDDGNYIQSYFKVTLPQLDFDIYACAAVTQEMKINMRSGDCLGCTFTVMVDWDDYKLNFYDEDGNFAPNGSQRDLTKYPNSANGQVTLMLQKEIETFGRLMPNIYQTPEAGDRFVILGISLPQVYVTNAESRLEDEMKQYMHDNNVYYFDYPLKFDEYFLANNTDILSQMKNNTVVRFTYAGTTYALYIKQMSIKYGQSPLPQYDITLTDDVEIVLNPVGQVANEVSNLRILMGGGGFGGGEGDVDERYLRKDIDDTASGFITMLKGLQVGERFVTGLLGEGAVFRTESDGTTYLECDKMYVRMKAYFDTVEIRKYTHSGGNRIASPAGMTCTRVEFIDANGNIVSDVADAKSFKCYFKAQDDSRTITNDFVVGDLAYCKETNVDTSSVNQHSFWRLVTSKSSSANSDNEHWIMLSNKATEVLTIGGRQYSHSGYLSGSDAPLAYDDIIQLGNIADTTRQGAIIEMSSGADAPVYQIFQGISTFSLSNKNYISMGYASGNTNLHSAGHAYLEVMGDFYFGDSAIANPSTYIKYNSTTRELDIKANVKMTSPYTQQDTDLNAFAAAVKSNEDAIQAQIDGQIESWFYDYMPVASDASGAPLNRIPLTNKEPYKTWYEADNGGTASEVATERTKHLGDTFYDNTSGYAFRFSKNEQSNAFEWVAIEDSAVIKALADAAEAQDTADHKRRVFLETPVPPYDEGDLWANAVYPTTGTKTYDNDLLRCNNSKAEGESFSINDWQLATKYTDNSALLTFLDGYQGTLTDVNEQIDKKAETWYQDSDPSTAWTDNDKKAEHVGDIWCDTSANGGKKTYIWKDFGSSASTRYAWAQQAVPDEVFDQIDGKLAIYTSWGAWDTSTERKLQVKDLYIPQSTETGGGSTWTANKVYRCTSVGTFGSTNPTFQEINYTDDSRINNFINEILNGTGASGNDKTVADAIRAVNGALNEDTQVVGGLILTSLISLRNNGTTWAGISGMYSSSAFGGGIAAWYGGSMVDRYNSSTGTFGNSGAKSLFRFDGSGYVAGGNIYWNDSGAVTIQGTTIDATYLKKGGNSVATEGDLANYVTLATAQTITGAKKFSNSIQIGDIYLAYDSTNNAIKIYKMSNGSEAAANLYTTGGISAFGYSSGSGGGGVTLNHPLDTINSANLGSPTQAGQTLAYNGSSWVYSTSSMLRAMSIISSSSISAAGQISGATMSASGFYATGKDNTYVLLAGGGTKLLSEIGGGGSGSVNSITIGSSATQYTPDSNGNVNIPAYPTVPSNIVEQIVISGTSTPYQPSSGTVTLPSYPTVPTTVSSFTNDAGYITSYTDTKYTAGQQGKTGTKLYLVGTTTTGNADGTYATSYTNSNCYIGTDNCLYSCGTKVLTSYTEQYTGTVNSVKVGNTAYGASGGVVSLPAYPTVPTKVSQLTNDSGYITSYTDTKYTAGQQNNTGTKLYLVGTTTTGNASGTYATSYTNSNCYIGTDNCLYSGGTKVLTSYTEQYTGTVNSVKVGSTAYGASGGVVSLPAYPTVPTKVSQLTNDSGYITSYTDTKYTAGQQNNTGTKMYLVGTTTTGNASGTYATSYTNSNCYIGTDNCLYSGGSKVLTSEQYTGTVTSVKVNGTAYGASGGVVTLPDYPSLSGYATQAWVQQQGYATQASDTKNTTGTSVNDTVQLYIVGAVQQAAYAQTFTNSKCYISSSSYFSCVRNGGRAYSFGANNDCYMGLDTSGYYYLYTGSAYDFRLYTNGLERIRVRSTSGNVGVNKTDPAYTFQVGGPCAATAFPNTSDIRKKNVIASKTLELWQVAQAPMFTFTWNDPSFDKDVHIGSSAQYWQSHTPELVSGDTQGILSMQYDVIALLAAVTAAKKVQDHESRIQALERENAELKNEIKQLKAA